MRGGSSPADTRGALLVGVGVGLVAVLGYFLGGIAFELWTFREFLLEHTAFELGQLLLAAGLAIAVVGIPLTAYLRFRAVMPLLIFALLVFSWTVVGAARDLSLGEFFELALAASWFAPIYLVLYVATAGLEIALQNQSRL